LFERHRHSPYSDDTVRAPYPPLGSVFTARNAV
jgi:hypothetical protein